MHCSPTVLKFARFNNQHNYFELQRKQYVETWLKGLFKHAFCFALANYVGSYMSRETNVITSKI